ncbi:sodium:proton antiporter [Anaerotalea alkaliphila]|uniref:Cation:proton antiporter subunit C n=1 Tax=Anaerotalea alkaliphila TaxID=2662126 RepID=A0A7X5HVH8_9FIRM|nr:cation:proton antiporter subunit C [Anaerotalea alkaliphila]NDL67420.1 cation:proton antiporter subunit C [Anaerotalea alkaliphila]
MEWITGETVSILLFFIGLFGVVGRRNIIKTVVSIGIMETAIILFFLTIQGEGERVPPIVPLVGETVADPLPQALMITAIVIGVAVTAVSLTMFISLYHKYGTTNWHKVEVKRREQDT